MDQMVIQGEQADKKPKPASKSGVARLTVVKSEPKPAPEVREESGVTRSRKKAVKNTSARKTGAIKKKTASSAGQTARKVASKVSNWAKETPMAHVILWDAKRDRMDAWVRMNNSCRARTSIAAPGSCWMKSADARANRIGPRKSWTT